MSSKLQLPPIPRTFSLLLTHLLHSRLFHPCSPTHPSVHKSPACPGYFRRESANMWWEMELIYGCLILLSMSLELPSIRYSQANSPRTKTKRGAQPTDVGLLQRVPHPESHVRSAVSFKVIFYLLSFRSIIGLSFQLLPSKNISGKMQKIN